MEGAVQLFEKPRLRLDLNSLLQLSCLQNVPLSQVRYCKNQRFALDEDANAQEIAESLSRDSNDFDTAIAPDGHQTGRSENFDRQSNWLPTDPKPFCQRVLTQDRPGRKTTEPDLFPETAGNDSC